MKCAVASLCSALLWLVGCLDPLVSSPCGEGQSPCGGGCKATGACALDGGLDAEHIDWGAGEAGTSSPLDTAPFDLAEGLDEGSEGMRAPIDADDGEALPGVDVGRASDRPSDPIADRASADRKDVAGRDVRGADASDARRSDAADAAVPTKRDAPLLAPEDAKDGEDRHRNDAPDVPDDAPLLEPEVRADAEDVTSACGDCGVGSDARDAPDTSGLRSDVAGSEPGPESQPACPGQQVKCGGVCVDLQSSQANCGLCGYACSGVPCIAGQCQTCPNGRTLCDNQCIDTSTDPAHCGACNQNCASGACRFGVCKASTAGHIVVIGHDFRTSNVAMNRILGNAIFLPASGDVNVVEYLGVATNASVSNSHVAITQVSNTINRRAVFFSDFTFSADALATQLRSADVFLIQSQTVATDTILVELAQSWASVLSTFVHTGGIIVALDGSYPINNGTSQILAQAGLMKVSAVSAVNNDTCSVITATDPVAASVPASYSCLQASAVFSGDGVHVVEDLGRPVVLHVAF